MIESLPLLLALAAIGAAAFFAWRAMQAQALAGGAELIKGERDRALVELKSVREENTRLTAELAAAKAQKAERSESEEARFLALAAKALEAELLAGWSDEQLLEVTMLAGHYAMLAGMLRSVGVQPEGPIARIGSVEPDADDLADDAAGGSRRVAEAGMES